MSPGNLSRLENGEHGPPSDEVITKLAAILDLDISELFKLAGRDLGGPSFEQQVLHELKRLQNDLAASRREAQTRFERVDSALSELTRAKEQS